MTPKSHVKGPRPKKNSDGQDKKPNPADMAPPRAPHPPGAVNPMTHPNHPGMAPVAPPTAPHDPKATGAPGDQRQVQERINFRDMPPPMQQQMEAQQGLDPDAPLKMLQSNVTGSVAQGPSQGMVPNTLQGPGVPPGLESFPDDMAHLHTLMQQGLGPGASSQEHALGQNAHAIARAHMDQAEQNAQNTAAYAANTQHLGALSSALAGQGQMPPSPQMAAGQAAMPTAAPQLGSGMAPPQAGAPGEVPPDLLEQLRKRAMMMKGAR